MGPLHWITRHIPEGLETGVLVALAVPSIMLLVRRFSEARWAMCFAGALVAFTYASVTAIPAMVLGSRLVGSIALAACPLIVFAATLASLSQVIELSGSRRIWAAAAGTGVLVAFGFVILVLPQLRTAARPQEYEDYRICRANLRAIGEALVAYALDHKGGYPSREDLPDALTTAPAGDKARRGPYLEDTSVIYCPTARRSAKSTEASVSHGLGDYTYARPARRDPPETYILRCHRHARVRRFWTEKVGLYLRKDGQVDVVPLAEPK